jgi:hypothetical protein
VADANDTGRTVDPSTDGERAVLRALPSLKSGTPLKVSDMTVVAAPPYSSASGRTCRALSVTGRASKEIAKRLACNNGQNWFFVPEVFGGNGLGE